MSRKLSAGFSLVEVVTALGIVVFAGFALIGLFATGLQTGSDSKQRFQAATIAEALCATRRAMPVTDLPSQDKFPLPKLGVSGNNFSAPTWLTWSGEVTRNRDEAKFGLLYNIVAQQTAADQPGKATVYLYLYWPPQSAEKHSHFDLTTAFVLP